jgi:DNA-binding transcriptional LysR family regulator
MSLDDTAAFVAVGKLGSFTRAAERLGVPKGTVSRQVARLERRLGARLLQRTTRRVALTDVGRAYFERCRHAVDSIEDAARLVADVTGTVTGTLRVATSFDFGRDRLSAWLPELHQRHPELRLELELSQRRVDLVEDGIDVAIRGGPPMGDSGLVARKLAESGLVFCATPAYLRAHGTPRSLADLAQHECLTLHLPGSASRWRLSGPEGPVDVDLHGWLRVNEIGVLNDAVRADSGIGLCEAIAVRVAVRARRLVHILPEYVLGPGGLWAIYPSAHHLSPKVRAFVDFVAEKVAGLIEREGRPPPKARKKRPT